MRAWLAIFALLLSAPSLRAAEQLTAEEFLRSADIGQTANAIAGIAIGNMQLGLSWANAYLKMARKADPLYCVPPRLAFTEEQLIAMLRREVRNDPAIGKQPYGLALLLTMRRTFPCE